MLDTSTRQSSSPLLETLLDGISTADELQERISDLSREQQRELLDLARRHRAAENAVDYVEYVFAEQLTDGGGFLPAHILELYDFVDSCIADGEHGLALEPRGSSKSTSVTIGKLAHHIAKNPNIRVGLFSNTATQAEAFSRAIRTTIGENDRHIEIFGPGVGPKWTDSQWIHGQSSHKAGSKDLTVYAQGVFGAIISKRFDIVIFDDILDEENTSSMDQMEKVETWIWKTIKPCLVPGGIMIFIGTRWADDDVYERLMKPKEQGGKGFRSLVKGALVEVDGELQSYWPERWTVETLLKEREDMGSAIFACVYQNDVTGLMRGNIFPRLSESYYFTQLPEGHEYTLRMGIDLASSEKERADWTARVVTAQDEDGNFFVLSAYRDKRETHHAEFIADGFQAYPNVALVICDSQAFQSTLIQEVMEDYPGIPITGRKNDVDKTTRGRAVAAKYEAHKVYHHASLRDTDFERELLSFNKGHDDFVDSLGYSMDLQGGGFFFGVLKHGAATKR